MKFKYFISMVDFSSKCDMYVCFFTSSDISFAKNYNYF
jgi:hypothetical protein